MPFLNRNDAGQKLAVYLAKYKNDPNACVIGLPRGGVVVAYEVAKALKLPLDFLIVRKVGAPGNSEFALGAITETGEGFFNEEIIAMLRVSKAYIEKACAEERDVAARRSDAYRKYRQKINLKDKTIILIDDGLATGATMKASINALKAGGAGRIVVAIPVASRYTFEDIKRMSDEAIAIELPANFWAVGQVYRDFCQTTDDQVIEILYSARPDRSILAKKNPRD